jgi:hypothetical protein
MQNRRTIIENSILCMAGLLLETPVFGGCITKFYILKIVTNNYPYGKKECD